MEIAAFLGGTLALIIFGMPIAFALGLASLAYLYLSGIPPVTFVQQLSGGINSFTLLALPFFILAGQLMNHGGITTKIFRFANALVGHVRGGLAHANILATMVFASIAGSAVAVAGALGAVQVDAMQRNGYDRKFSAGLISAAMTIGPVIPPSVVMVVYAIAAGVSIGEVFVAGIIPGLIMGVALMAYVGWKSSREGFPRYSESFSYAELWTSFREASLALLAPLIIIGGIISGVFTATESGAVAAIYSVVVGAFVYRELTWRLAWKALVDTMMLSATILLIMGMSSSFSYVLAFERIPATLASLLISVSENATVILLIMMAFYLVLGCFIEAIAIIVMTISVVLPIIVALNIDPVHFGVILAINMSLGTITPPLGIVLYVMARTADMTATVVARATMPMFAILVAVLVLLVLFPSITLFLPEVAM